MELNKKRSFFELIFEYSSFHSAPTSFFSYTANLLIVNYTFFVCNPLVEKENGWFYIKLNKKRSFFELIFEYSSFHSAPTSFFSYTANVLIVKHTYVHILNVPMYTILHKTQKH